MKIRGIKSPIQVQKPQNVGLGELLPLLQDLATKQQDILRMHGEFKQLHGDVMGKIASIKQGPPGRDGMGIPGRDGATPEVDYEKILRLVMPKIKVPQNGKDGRDGKSAPSMEEIISTVFSPERADLQKIVDMRLDPHVQNLRRLVMTGGGDTVAAGSGVTITTTNGVKTISSTGFSTLASTETPNGNLTVFTFSAATAQPTYIVSDNVWFRATTKSGTVNWTWNAGLKQATLTIPPTDEIYAVV